MTNIQNVVHLAVSKIGGVIHTAYRLEVHPNTVNAWIKKGTVPKVRDAKRLSKLSGFEVEVLHSMEAVK